MIDTENPFAATGAHRPDPESTGDEQEQQEPSFRAYHPPAEERPRWAHPLVIFGAAVVVAAIGLAMQWGSPADVEAETGPADYASMSCEALARDAGVGAARELIRRMGGEAHGAEAARAAVRDFPSERLMRNLAFAQGLETQQRALEQQREHQRMAEAAERGAAYPPAR